MKTAISLPDELYEEADAVADRIGVSRSQLYATALAEYLARLRSEDVTAQLNVVYAEEPDTRDGALRAAARKSVRRAAWQWREVRSGGRTSACPPALSRDFVVRCLSCNPTRSIGVASVLSWQWC